MSKRQDPSPQLPEGPLAGACEPPELYPLTHPQLRIWYTELLCPGTAVANLTMQVTLEGAADLEKLRQAIDESAAAFDCLWLQLEPPADDATLPLQRFTAPEHLDIAHVDLKADELHAWCQAEAARPRERFRTRLFSFTLLTWGDQHGYLFLGHHAVCDGTTCDLLFAEISRRYDARRAGIAVIPAAYGSYRDFITSERAYLPSVRNLG